MQLSWQCSVTTHFEDKYMGPACLAPLEYRWQMLSARLAAWILPAGQTAWQSLLRLSTCKVSIGRGAAADLEACVTLESSHEPLIVLNVLLQHVSSGAEIRQLVRLLPVLHLHLQREGKLCRAPAWPEDKSAVRTCLSQHRPEVPTHETAAQLQLLQLPAGLVSSFCLLSRHRLQPGNSCQSRTSRGQLPLCRGHSAQAWRCHHQRAPCTGTVLQQFHSHLK